MDSLRYRRVTQAWAAAFRWRTIPVGENVTIRVTDRSAGSGNVLAFDTVIYEGEILRD